MKIDRKLNVVLTLDRDDGSKLYVHAAPISREAFDAHWRTLSTAYAEIAGGALRGVANRVAMKMIRQVGEDQGQPADGLVAEIRRMAMVVVSNSGKWEPIPLQQAIDSGLLDEEEAAEVDNNIAFFTCFWHMTPRAERMARIDGLAKAWGAQTSSSDSMAWATSLATSTATGNSGQKETPSSTQS